jgi:aminomethyltransferase
VSTPLKRTPLYHEHVAAGARMVPFGGWEMPVQYTGIIEEHRAARNAVGLFDVSHMGEFEVEGPGALAALQHLTTNDVAALEVGQVQYSVLCYPSGTIVDDLTVYRLADARYMITVNAGNIDKDWAHVTTSTAHIKDTRWRNASEGTGLIAVQGPKAERLVGRLADCDVTAIGYYRFARGHVAEVPTVISRTGYTGEDGFELYAPADGTVKLWKALLAAGRADGATPVGLGARDTLRLEMKYALYGNDIDETTNALEAGLGWVVKLAKGDFLGRAALSAQASAGVSRRLVGIQLDGPGIPRHGYSVWRDGTAVGRVTSGARSPTLGTFIGLAYVAIGAAAPGTPVAIEIRGRRVSARVVPRPFYRRVLRES